MPARPQPSGDATAQEPSTRFDCTISTVDRAAAIEVVTSKDLDRLPDLDGQIRVLLTLDQVGDLVENGQEVHVRAAVTVAPLDQSLILDDRSAQAWLEEQVAGIPRQGGT